MQPRLTLDQRLLGRALAVQQQKIEGIADELIGAAFIHGGLEPAKDR